MVAAEIKKLYEPDTFYEHGDNPAYKRFMEIATKTFNEGKQPEHRSNIKDTKARLLMARNFDDLMQRDFKVYTAPRAIGAFVCATLGLGNLIGWSNRMLPVGQFGITKLSQTPFYHKFGRIPAIAVAAVPYIAFYVWFRVTTFCFRRIWNNVVLQDRVWAFEQERFPYYGHYYFMDTPLSCPDAMPALATIEMQNSNKAPIPDWAT